MKNKKLKNNLISFLSFAGFFSTCTIIIFSISTLLYEVANFSTLNCFLAGYFLSIIYNYTINLEFVKQKLNNCKQPICASLVFNLLLSIVLISYVAIFQQLNINYYITILTSLLISLFASYAFYSIFKQKKGKNYANRIQQNN